MLKEPSNSEVILGNIQDIFKLFKKKKKKKKGSVTISEMIKLSSDRLASWILNTNMKFVLGSLMDDDISQVQTLLDSVNVLLIKFWSRAWATV